MREKSPDPSNVPPDMSTVRTDITRTMSLTEALVIACRKAGKDPLQAIAVFDFSDPTIVANRSVLPPKGEHFAILFRDFTWVEAEITGKRPLSANT